MPGLNPLPYNQGSWFTSDLLAYRPEATPANAGNLYWVTDLDGGTLFHSDGYNWNQVTTGLNVAFANPMTTAGDLIEGGASGVPTRKAIGSTGQVLTVVAGAAAWASPNLLAVHAYAAGADAAVTSTSTSFVDVDATHHTVTFTAPASGNVLVRVSGLFSSADALNNVFFGLREATTDLAGTSRLVLQSLSGGEYTPGTLVFYLTGISAGAHTYKLSFKTSNAATAVEVSTGPTYGQTVYEVWAN